MSKKGKKVADKVKNAAGARLGSVVDNLTNMNGGSQVSKATNIAKIADAIVDNQKAGNTNLNIANFANEVGLSTSYIGVILRSKELTTKLQSSGLSVKVGKGATFEVLASGGAGSPNILALPDITTDPTLKKKKKSTRAKAKATVAKQPKLNKDFFNIPELRGIKLTAAINAGFNLWLVGPTGTGKSETVERLCEKMKRNTHKISCNGESSADDLLGFWTVRGGDTVWVDGALPMAMKEGALLICEEIDAAAPEVNLALQRALEVREGRAREFYNPRNGEKVEAADGFTIAATANTAGGGDHSGLYQGTQAQNAAFRDRFVFEHIDYLDEKSEINVLCIRTGVKKEFAKKMVRMAREARQALTDGTIFTPVSTRTLLAWASMIHTLIDAGMDEGYAIRESLLSAVIYKAASPSDATALEEYAQRVFGF